jgi:hypothetical protein
MVSFASALVFNGLLIAVIGLHRVLRFFEESFHGQQTLRGQPALLFPR